MKEKVRKSLDLSPGEWEHLEDLAKKFGTCPPSGPTAGKPAWRSLIKELSRGNLRIVDSWPGEEKAVAEEVAG